MDKYTVEAYNCQYNVNELQNGNVCELYVCMETIIVSDQVHNSNSS